MGTKERRRDGLYDQLLEVAHREDDLDPNSSLAEIYARIHAKDVKHSWATQIEKVRDGRVGLIVLLCKGTLSRQFGPEQQPGRDLCAHPRQGREALVGNADREGGRVNLKEL